MYRDRLATPVEEAVFWMEYILKYHGAPHLNYSGRTLNFFQAYSLDVVAFIAVVLYVFYRVLKTLLKLVVRKVFRRSKINEKKLN